MSQSSKTPFVVWIYSGDLDHVLDASTWLKTVSELRNCGWRVILVSTGPRGRHQIHGVEVYSISRPEIYLLRHAIYHLKVLLLILKQFADIDLIIFHEISAPWILPLRFLRKLISRRRPLFVIDTRSLPMSHLGKETWRERLRRGAFRMETQMSNNCSDGRLAITPRMAEAVHIPTKKLWGTWPSGADIEHFAHARLGRNWPSSDDAVQLIYHGTLHHERNLTTLCHATARANFEGMSFELSLVGNGTGRAELEEIAMNSKGFIRVVRQIQYEKMPSILATSHIGVLPFQDEEKFRVSSPIKLFEYMAAGLPILATRIVCHTDVIGNGNYVFWAEDANEQGLFDALTIIWQSRDSLSKMGSRAAMISEEWSWKASADKLKKALETGIEQSKSV